MATTPTARTLAWLKKQGYTAGVVEKWIPQTRQRKDLFGFIDLIAIREGETVGIQATSTGNMASRVKKIMDSEHMPTWLLAGNKLWVVGWAKRGKAGKRKLWTASVTKLDEELRNK